MSSWLVSNGRPVALDQRVFSWSQTGSGWAELGSAYSEGDYLFNNGAPNLADPRAVWKTQRSIRTVVGFIARNLAQVSIHAFVRGADGDRSRLPVTHPLVRALSRPGPTPYQFVETMAIDLCLWDRWLARPVVDDEGRVKLHRVPPHSWSFARDKFNEPEGVVAGWETPPDGKLRIRPLDEFVWIDGYPGEFDATPLSTLTDLLTEEQSSGRYRRELWDGGARIPGWIERPLESPQWSLAARDNFRTGWRTFASGGASAGRDPILEDGMKYHETKGITPEQAQQLESRKLTISEVAAAYYVPPMFVGVLEAANYSNVSAFREILYSDTLGPWFQKIQQALQLRLVPRLADPDDVYVEFNVAEKLRLAFDEQARIFQTTTGGPIMTRNEARQRLNLPRLDGADELIVPLNVIEGGQASPTDISPTAGGVSGGSVPSADDAASTPAEMAKEAVRALQQMYLAVDVVITVEEARRIVSQIGGIDLPGGLPAPEGS